MEKMRKNDKIRWGGLTLSLCIALAFYYFLTHMSDFNTAVSYFMGLFSTVLIGAVIAYIVNPLAMFFDRHFPRKWKANRRWILSSVLALLLVLGICIGLFSAFIPYFIDNVREFVGRLNLYKHQLMNLVASLQIDDGLKASTLSIIDTQIDVNGKLTEYLNNNFSNIVSMSTMVGRRILNALIGIIFAFYFLIGKKKLVSILATFAKLVTPDRYESHLNGIWKQFNSIFSRYIVFTLLEALTVGFLNAYFMLITGTPYVVLISVVVGVTNLAPTFGPIFGGAFGAVLLLLAEPGRVIPFIIFTIILQLIDGYIVKPKLYGEALNVPSFLVLTFLVVGGKLWGFTGLLLAIPTAALLSYIYNNIIIPWLRSRKDSTKKLAAEEATSDAGADIPSE